jgi:hypothetical protein
MNERIKLPAQEWLGYDPERGDLHGYTFEQMREFAELIIKECLNNMENCDGNLDFCIWKTKKEFGVE